MPLRSTGTMRGMDLSPVELVGYLGSLLIVLSMTRTSILQLRVIGLAGSITFFAYSLLIGAVPVTIVNSVLMGVHIYFLRQLLSKKREYFSSLELNKDSRYLRYFLDFNQADIQAHQPGFVFEPRDDQVRAFVLRDTAPAGVFIGRTYADDSVEVELDYVIPEYRDFKVAEFLYSDRSEIFGQRGRRRVWTRPGNASHIEYFRRLGFKPATIEEGDVLLADLDDVVRIGSR